MPPRNYRKPDARDARADNLNSAHDHALVALREAERVLLGGHPRVRPDVAALETAAWRLQNYVAELKA